MARAHPPPDVAWVQTADSARGVDHAGLPKGKKVTIAAPATAAPCIVWEVVGVGIVRNATELRSCTTRAERAHVRTIFSAVCSHNCYHKVVGGGRWRDPKNFKIIFFGRDTPSALSKEDADICLSVCVVFTSSRCFFPTASVHLESRADSPS